MPIQIKNNSSSADILIFGEIGWETNASNFARELSSLTATTINIRINSAGGSVFDGIAIYNAIKRHPANKIAHIEGACLSAATYPALAADEVVMNQSSFWMIHDVSAVAYGNAEALRKQAEMAERIQDQVADIYANATGREKPEIVGLMNAETWWTAQEAVDFGWADRVENWQADNVACDLSVFRNVPNSLKEQTRQPTPRQVERALRNVGLSQKDAKAFVSKYVAGRDRRDGDAQQDGSHRDGVFPKDVADQLRQYASLWK